MYGESSFGGDLVGVVVVALVAKPAGSVVELLASGCGKVCDGGEFCSELAACVEPPVEESERTVCLVLCGKHDVHVPAQMVHGVGAGVQLQDLPALACLLHHLLVKVVKVCSHLVHTGRALQVALGKHRALNHPPHPLRRTLLPPFRRERPPPRTCKLPSCRRRNVHVLQQNGRRERRENVHPVACVGVPASTHLEVERTIHSTIMSVCMCVG